VEEILSYLMVLVAGLFAGAINTMAGGGSFISLPALIALGLSPGVANGSNRIAILFQSGIASVVYARANKLDVRRGLAWAGVTAVGAVIGAGVASSLSENIFGRIFGVLFIVMSLILLFKKKLLSGGTHRLSHSKLLALIVFVMIGFYGGFIQAGVGILMLLAFSTLLGWDIVEANGLKNFIAFLYTIPALLFFAVNDKVDYQAGLLLACGNIIGGYWGAKWSLKNGQKWLLRVVVVIALFSGIGMLFRPLA
jgi:hypothetical protein